MQKQRPKVFLDTSALIAGIASSKDSARAVLQLKPENCHARGIFEAFQEIYRIAALGGKVV